MFRQNRDDLLDEQSDLCICPTYSAKEIRRVLDAGCNLQLFPETLIVAL
jgi:hypothetical protein